MAHVSLQWRGQQAAYLASLPVLWTLTSLASAAEAAPGATASVQGAATQANAVAPRQAATTRSLDQLWLVSCRSVSYNRHDDDLDELQYAVQRPATGWTTTNQTEFFQSPATLSTTCVLVLGNGYSAAETRSLGQTAYRRLTADLPPQAAVRFVIWSWPSDHIDAGPIKDVRAKTARTPHVAYCLARWLDKTPASGHVSLLGTSFGARIVMEALELRSGGTIGGLRLANAPDVVRPKPKVALISAAIDSDWLLPGRRLSHAVSQTDGLLLLNNGSDNVLSRYHWVYGPRSKATALGVTGLRGSWQLGDDANKVKQLDASSIIGRNHGCGPYFDSPRLVAAMRSHLFSDEAQTPHVPTEGLPIPVAAKPERETARQ